MLLALCAMLAATRRAATPLDGSGCLPSNPTWVSGCPTVVTPANEPLYMTLRRRLAAWRAAGGSPQVMRWLREGARCEWTSTPPPPFHLGVSLAGSSAPVGEEAAWLEREISRLVGNGALVEAPPEERTHVSRVHLAATRPDLTT